MHDVGLSVNFSTECAEDYCPNDQYCEKIRGEFFCTPFPETTSISPLTPYPSSTTLAPIGKKLICILKFDQLKES